MSSDDPDELDRELSDGGHRSLIPLAGADISLSNLGVVDQAAVEDLEQRVKWVENHSEGARTVAKNAMQRVNELEEELKERRNRDANLVGQIQTLEREIDDLSERTQLLQAIQNAGALKKDQRVAVLLQTLYNKAKRHAREDNGTPTATADINTYEDALGGDVETTYFYRDAKAAVELVGDEDVLKFKQEAPGARKNSRLILNLDEGDLPAIIAGRDIGDGGNQWTA